MKQKRHKRITAMIGGTAGMGLISVFKIRYGMEKECVMDKVHNTMFSDEIIVGSAKTASDILGQVFFPDNEVDEYLYLMCCDCNNMVKGMFVVSQGGIASALANVRGVLQCSLLCNAVNIIVARNNGNIKNEFIKEDKVFYDKLKQACEATGINIIDYMILHDSGYLSCNEKGYNFIEFSSKQYEELL